MYHSGLIGNIGLLEVLGKLTAGKFNKMLPKGKALYKQKDIIPNAYVFIYPPLSEQDKREQVNQSLLAFALMSPGAPSILKGK